MDEQKLREILEQNVEVPVIVDDKLKNTYAQLDNAAVKDPIDRQ